MWRYLLVSPVAILALVAFFGLESSALAQPAPPATASPPTYAPQAAAETPPAPRKRALYPARFLPATDLAKALGVLFQQESRGTVSVAAEPIGNQLLISGSEASVAEMLELATTLDRQPKTIAVDIWILELKQGEGKDLAFSGPLDKIMPQILELEKAGVLSIANRIQLGGLENQPSMVQQGERRPFVRSSQRTPVGNVNSTTVESMGTMATATTRVATEEELVMELSVEKSYPAPLEEAVVIATGSDGKEVKTQGSLVMTCRATVALKSGHAITLSGITRSATAPEVRVLVSARVVERDAHPQDHAEK